jgi:Protein of unknown function (DUF3619)
MNQQDELATRIARLLDESTDKLSPQRRDALAQAREAALARYSAQRQRVAAPAWASTIGNITERSVFGVRYLIPLAALVLGLIGVLYVQTNGVMSSIADIDLRLLTDELPIDAYLDKDFESWLERSSH